MDEDPKLHSAKEHEITRRSFVGLAAGAIGVLTQPTLAAARPLSPRAASEVQAGKKSSAESHTLQNAAGISVSVDSAKGTYNVKYRQQSWFGPGIVSVLAGGRWYRSTDIVLPELTPSGQPQGKLISNGIRQGSASDRLGAYEFLDIEWKVPSTNIDLVTGFKLYTERPVLKFVQRFPNGFQHYASGNWTVPSVNFPQFLTDYSARRDLSSWVSGGMFAHRFAYGPASSLQGTVDLLVLVDDENETLILSPFSNYLTATQQCAPVASNTETSPYKAFISCGIEGLVEELPAGFEQEHVMVVGEGVNRTFQVWGDLLLARAGKSRPSKYTGDTLKYPVYWDDYGSYYRQHGFKEEGYKSYEEIILGIAEDAKKNGLRIGAYQVQDLDQLRTNEGIFEPRADLFPHGLKWLHEKLGAPLEAYVAWLAPNGPYRQKYPFFATDGGGQAPEHSMGDVFYSEQYWNDTADKLASWGAILLQHDFLSVYEGNPVMMSGIDKMDRYFRNMANALQRRGMHMQYCMAFPRNIMQATENPTVISLQGTLDHHVPTAGPQSFPYIAAGGLIDEDLFSWKHVIFTSAFYGAVGLWPSRDNIQTTADPNAYEDILVANLLGGEIQLGHRIGECNFDLVKKTYRDGDCLILKPDHPIVPLDRCYREGGVIGYTQSECSGRAWFYVLSLPKSGYLSSFRIAELGVEGTWIVYNHDSRTAVLRQHDGWIDLNDSAKHEYFIVAPVLSRELAVFGDVSKFVSMADMRIASVDEDGDSVVIGVISGMQHSPIVTGYSAQSPKTVQFQNAALARISSLSQLERERSGWFWDYQTKLWHVKIDFSDAGAMETRSFRIS